MKKLYLLALFLIFIIGGNLFAQQTPVVYDSIQVDDLAGASKWLKFGLAPLATDSLDEFLGEMDLPPLPPAGAFDTRFLFPENNFLGTLSSHEDYRFMDSVPYSGTKEFRIQYQPAFGTVIKLTWNLPLNVSGVLQDVIIGTLINVPMNGSGEFTVTNPSGFNKLKMLITYNQIIPVELTSFTAVYLESGIKLDWVTATETNNQGFEVQRKTVNSEWTKIGFVDGAGTTTERTSYSFVDQFSGQGIVSYRLKQIDFDGTSTYSKVVEVDLTAPADFKLNQNYPNPFNPSTAVSFIIPDASNVKLSIFNQLGQLVDELVNKELEAGYYTYTWNAVSQPSGIYFYELQANDFKSVKKMTLVK